MESWDVRLRVFSSLFFQYFYISRSRSSSFKFFFPFLLNSFLYSLSSSSLLFSLLLLSFRENLLNYLKYGYNRFRTFFFAINASFPLLLKISMGRRLPPLNIPPLPPKARGPDRLGNPNYCLFFIPKF